MVRKVLSTFVFACLLAGAARGDEGMWLFNAFPREQVGKQYGFAPDQQWLDHVRLSSVRFNNGGSGSFVSADGLTFTNHHVGSECIQQASTKEHDYMKDGFYARTREEEKKCPGLELNVLWEIEDVTGKVRGAAREGMPAAEAGQAQRAAMSALEKECAERTGLRCDVVTLYAGGMYHLYHYKRYQDVRLVFAPEVDAAFFGGDPDNFNYPRYVIDAAFFRVYEDGKPARVANHLRWSTAGVKEGDVVFVSGHPGSTRRQNTMAQLAFLRDVQYPWALKSLPARLAVLREFSRRSAENERLAQDDILSLENAVKATQGYQAALLDRELMARRGREETELRKGADEGAWRRIGDAMHAQREIFGPLTFLENRAGFRGSLALFARHLVRLAEERQKPDGQRLREYREAAWPSLQQQLFSEAPIHKEMQAAVLAHSLDEMAEFLGADHPVVRAVLQGRTAAEVARQAIAGTRLDDVQARRELLEGGAPSIAASKDPLIVMMRAVDTPARAARKRFEDEVDSVVRAAGEELARLRFERAGPAQYPDATFTLRLSYGAVRGYYEGGERLPYFTTLEGKFRHAERHGSKPPYQLPASWTENRKRLKLDTPYNVVSTADIIGGNSGSPVVDRNGDVVGIIFDGNIHSLSWNFVYDDRVARAIHVDTRGIEEALRVIYATDGLLKELKSGAPRQ